MGRVELQPDIINMNALTFEVLASFEYAIKEKNIKVDIAELPICTGDKSMINQVISNFIDNSIKYLKDVKEPNIRINGYTESNDVVYTIEDNGIGIKPEYQEQIFELFQRFNYDTHGEGIGLTFIKKIIEKHNGRVWLDSTPGKGSKFFFSLPNNTPNK